MITKYASQFFKAGYGPVQQLFSEADVQKRFNLACRGGGGGGGFKAVSAVQ